MPHIENSVILERLETSNEGTFGIISTHDEIFYVGEQPWRDNRPNISCVPCGVYRCVWTFSPRFKRFMYLVGGVNGRLGIRFHPANFMGDRSMGYSSHLHGCIALGDRLGYLSGQKALLVSRPAVKKFETLMNFEPFTLEIKWNL